MKKTILILLLFYVFIQKTDAQETRVNLYGGYVFDDKFDSYYDPYNYYNGKIKGGFQYGVGIEYMSHEDYGFELLYIGQSTTAPTYYYADNYLIQRYTEFDLNLNYAMIGGNRHMMSSSGKMEGYGGFMLGALFANVKNPETGNGQSATKFAWGLKLGGNFWLSDRFGLKLQGQLLSAVQSVGGSLYFGTGGAGAGVTTYSSMLQFSASSGFVLRMGN